VLTVEAARRAAAVDEKTVRSLAAKGELPRPQARAPLAVPRQAVLDWLAMPERKRRAAGFEG